MTRKRNNIIHYFILLFLSFTNLAIMHYLIGQYVEVPLDATSYINNAIGILFDISALICFLFVLFKGNIKKVFGFTFFISLLWAFSNILYSRFFFQYISFSAVSQIGNIFDILIIRCLLESLRWTDLLFLIILFMGMLLYCNTNNLPIKLKIFFLSNFLILIFSCILVISATIIYSISNPSTKSLGYIKHHIITHHFDLYRNSANPNWTVFQRGTLRTVLQSQIHSLLSSKELTTNQISLINKEIHTHNKKITNCSIPHIENVIFIIVESYLSATSDMIIDGKEITPNLNALKQDSTVCFNGNIKSNITIGESGDGQFICMTGLLPLRSEITVGKVKNNVLPGLPKVLAEEMHLKTRMLIPTTPSMWEQEQMCKQYGISKLYSSNDFNPEKGDLNDEQIFENLLALDKQSTNPFFSIVLTMSMHQPYNHCIDKDFKLSHKGYSNEFLNYLNACHYTDFQIGKYLKQLRDIGIYDKSLIIITADHHPNPNSLKIESICNDIPIYILNSGLNNYFYSGVCQQIDIYTTILDMLVKKPLVWRGLGHTLLSSSYTSSLSQIKWDLSEWIIQSNYFKTNNN